MILLFTLFKLKLVVVKFPLKIVAVEFTTVFVIKFLTGMSLPPKINGDSSFYMSADLMFGGNTSLHLDY